MQPDTTRNSSRNERVGRLKSSLQYAPKQELYWYSIPLAHLWQCRMQSLIPRIPGRAYNSATNDNYKIIMSPKWILLVLEAYFLLFLTKIVFYKINQVPKERIRVITKVYLIEQPICEARFLFRLWNTVKYDNFGPISPYQIFFQEMFEFHTQGYVYSPHVWRKTTPDFTWRWLL